MQEMTVRALMAKHPMAIKTGTELTEVVDALLQHKFTGLPVVDSQNKVVGFVSEQDCLRKLLISSYHCEGALVVEDFMHDQPLTVKEDGNFQLDYPALSHLLEERFRKSAYLQLSVILSKLQNGYPKMLKRLTQ